MHCAWVQDRLVAFADQELSPGEDSFVAEHISHCADCRELESQLRECSPEPSIAIPPEVLNKLAMAVDLAVSEEFDRPTVPVEPASTTRWARWLRRDRDLSNGAMLSYGVLFAACLGWGLSNWVAVQELRAQTRAPSIFTAAPTRSSTIGVDQYVPASYSPEDADENWR